MASSLTMSGINSAAAIFNINKASMDMLRSQTALATGKLNAEPATVAIGASLENNSAIQKAQLMLMKQMDNVLSTIDRTLSGVSDIYQRQKVIAIQTNNGTLNDMDRAFLNQEFVELGKEADRMIGSAKFNNISLFNSSVFNAKSVFTQGLGNFSLLDMLDSNIAQGLTSLLGLNQTT